MAKRSAPSGFRDFLPEQYRKRQELIRRIREVYESFGYEGMDTPALENLSVFQGKGGGENEKLMFHVLKRGADLQRALEKGGNELSDTALRFDLTVPLARYYATHRSELPTIFKRYQMGPVWRAERPQYGRFREFVQCDVDVLGSSSMAVEADVLSATTTALARLGFTGLTVRLNSRPLLHMLGDSFGTTQSAQFFTVLDKLDKITVEEAKIELQQCGCAEGKVQELLEYRLAVSKFAPAALLEDLSRKLDERAKPFVEQLKEILALTPPLPSGQLVFDPFLARGMDYYTGPIFEVAAEGVPFSLAGGGRFDGLVDKIAGTKPGPQGGVPACGFSIGFERVFTLMEERGMFAAEQRGADVLLVSSGQPESDPSAPMRLADELRKAGLKVDVFPGVAKPVQHFTYAEQKCIPFAIRLGHQPETFIVRTLSTREDVQKSKADLIAYLLERRT